VSLFHRRVVAHPGAGTIHDLALSLWGLNQTGRAAVKVFKSNAEIRLGAGTGLRGRRLFPHERGWICTTIRLAVFSIIYAISGIGARRNLVGFL
jgi:hypothetical protein